MIRAIALALLLPGCATIGGWGYYGPRTIDPYAVGGGAYGAPDGVVITRPPDLYTRTEVDALNAEIACRANARNSLQAQRCGVRR